MRAGLRAGPFGIVTEQRSVAGRRFAQRVPLRTALARLGPRGTGVQTGWAKSLSAVAHAEGFLKRDFAQAAEGDPVKQVEAAVIGTGWCGGIRSETLARSALVDKLHVCEIRPERLAEIQKVTNAATATLDYQEIVRNRRISVVYICTTPEQTHFPIARDCLKAGKHVLLEKPIAMDLWEADELITLARRGRIPTVGDLPGCRRWCSGSSGIGWPTACRGRGTPADAGLRSRLPAQSADVR